MRLHKSTRWATPLTLAASLAAGAALLLMGEPAQAAAAHACLHAAAPQETP
jgi:hypothetical protein